MFVFEIWFLIIIHHLPLVPDYPLSYSLQSRSRECVSYTDAPAHTGLST